MDHKFLVNAHTVAQSEDSLQNLMDWCGDYIRKDGKVTFIRNVIATYGDIRRHWFIAWKYFFEHPLSSAKDCEADEQVSINPNIYDHLVKDNILREHRRNGEYIYTAVHPAKWDI